MPQCVSPALACKSKPPAAEQNQRRESRRSNIHTRLPRATSPAAPGALRYYAPDSDLPSVCARNPRRCAASAGVFLGTERSREGEASSSQTPLGDGWGVASLLCQRAVFKEAPAWPRPPPRHSELDPAGTRSNGGLSFPSVWRDCKRGWEGRGGVLNEGSAQKWNRAKMATLREKKKLRERLRYQGRGQARAKTSPGNGAGKQAAWILEHATVNNSFP